MCNDNILQHEGVQEYALEYNSQKTNIQLRVLLKWIRSASLVQQHS